jgi:hypothetical protein
MTLSQGCQPPRDRESVLEDEKVRRADPEHDKRVPVQAIPRPPPPRARAIFGHRERIDIADTAAVKISRTCVVQGVRAPPEPIGREGQNTADAADPIVCQSMTKERAVAAIVLDHEQPHQKSGSGHGQ